MSEEERKAIEIIKNEIDRYKAIETPKEVYITDIKMLLSIINKQQEKEKNKLLIESRFGEVADKNSYIKDNYISKDTIREKIKELEEQRKRKEKEDTVDLFYDEIDITNIIKVLNELLEK